MAVRAGGTATIISSDKDLMQLVGPGVMMRDPMKDRMIGEAEVFERFGVEPARVADVQALSGDSVDNVPGAPGIGTKTAALLIQEYGDLETLLARAGEIKQPKRREALLENAEMIRISKQLVSLKTDMPMDVTLDELEVKLPAPDAIMDFLNRMEFRTLTRRVAERLKITPPAPADLAPAAPADDPTPAQEPTVQVFDLNAYECVRDMAALDRWIADIRDLGHVAIDTETTALDEMRAELVGISLSVKAGMACYIPVGHRQGGGDLFGSSDLVENQIPLADTIAALKPVLEDPAILKIAHNMKYDWKILARHGIRMAPIDDTMLMSYAMHAGLNLHGMNPLSDRYLGYQPVSIKTLLGSGKSQITFDRVAIEDAVKYAAEDADVTLRLWHLFKPQLHRAQVTTVYETLERPLVPVLADMEMHGIKVDRDTLHRMSNAFAQKLVQLEEEIHSLAGEKFNVGSPKQLGEVLFDRLKLPNGTQGKTGAYNTGADILEDITTLEDSYPQGARLAAASSTGARSPSSNPPTLTRCRLRSTPTPAASIPPIPSPGPAPGALPPPTRTCRTSRSAPRKAAASARRSSPRRPHPRLARLLPDRAAHPRPHRRHPRASPRLRGRHRHPRPHRVRDVQRPPRPDDLRHSPQSQGDQLRRDLRHFRLRPRPQPPHPRAEAQGFIDRYFERFPGIKEYMSDTVRFAQKNGYVQTLFGRKINTPEINAKGPAAGFAKRAAINAPIQGTAADVIRRAMIRMPKAIAGLDAKMLLQVHDELLFEVAEDAAQTLIPIAKDIMESAAHPAVSPQRSPRRRIRHRQKLGRGALGKLRLAHHEEDVLLLPHPAFPGVLKPQPR